MVKKLEEILKKFEDLKSPLDSQPISYSDMSPLNVKNGLHNFKVSGLIIDYQTIVFGSKGLLNQLFSLQPMLCDFVVEFWHLTNRIFMKSFYHP